jgi:hypothetical protein
VLTLFDILELLIYLQTNKINIHDQRILCCGTYDRTYKIGTYGRTYKTNKTTYCTSTWVTYKNFNKECVTLGASSLMELNIGSIVFVLMTCLLHKKKNMCKTSGIVSYTSQEFGIYKETYHLFGILPWVYKIVPLFITNAFERRSFHNQM